MFQQNRRSTGLAGSEPDVKVPDVSVLLKVWGVISNENSSSNWQEWREEKRRSAKG